MPTTDRIRREFDELADLVEPGASGTDHYDPFLLSLVPSSARNILEIGCGLGRLTRAMASANRSIIGVDLSPRMIERARLAGTHANVGLNLSFIEGDFMALDFPNPFDCVISAATLHHMPHDICLARMSALVRPGGRLVVHDVRRGEGIADTLRAYSALSGVMLARFARTRRLRARRSVRQAWDRHGAGEVYLSRAEAGALAARLPGSSLRYHWMWRYTLVWDRPQP